MLFCINWRVNEDCMLLCLSVRLFLWLYVCMIFVCTQHCHFDTVRDTYSVCRTFLDNSFRYYLNRIYVSLCTQSVLRVRKRVTLMGVTVTAIFVICWAPEVIAHNLDSYTSLSVSKLAYAVIHMLILFSSAVNPFVYALVNKTFREKLKGMICCSCTSSTGSKGNQVCQRQGHRLWSDQKM